MDSWPESDSDAYQRLREWSVGPDGVRTRVSLLPRSITLGFDAGRELETTGELVDARETIAQVLDKHPYVEGVDRSAIPLDWLGGGPSRDQRRNAFVAEAAQTLAKGMAALAGLEATSERVDSLLRAAFGVDAVNHDLRQLILGRTEDRYAPQDLPDMLHGYADLLEQARVSGLYEGLSDFARAASSGPTIWTVGQITELDPPQGCAGDLITIRGTNFGASQPPDVTVWFPSFPTICSRATVISWSDTEIVVGAPSKVSVGCVGFLQGAGVDVGELQDLADKIARSLNTWLGPTVADFADEIRRSAAQLAVVCPSCSSEHGAYFVGGLPRISWFLGNGAKETSLRPGDLLTLTYHVTNANSITITPLDADELPSVSVPLGASYGSIAFTVPASRSWTGKYELVAHGPCGQVVAQIVVHMAVREAFVLAGGGTRGAFEVGAVACLQRTFKITPDIICGSSVGALNGAKLAEGPGGLSELETLWEGLISNANMYTRQAWLSTLDQVVGRYFEAEAISIAESLVGGVAHAASNYLVNRLVTLVAGPVIGPMLTAPFSLVGAIQSGIDAFKFVDAVIKGMSSPSFYNSTPLANLIAANIDPSQVASSGIQLRITVAQLESGRTRLITEGSAFLDDGAPVPLSSACLASASIPVVFPAVTLSSATYVDGGTLENIPIAAAIQAGAETAYVIVPSPLRPPPAASFAGVPFHRVAPRSLEMLLDEMQRDELEPFQAYGIPLTIIAPRLAVHDGLFIDPGLISINMAYGYMCAFDEVQPDGNKRSQLRVLADEITTKRVAVWDLEHSANGEYLPFQDPAGPLQRVADSAPLLTARTLKKEVRQHVKDRQALSGSHAVPSGSQVWWQAWERHPWQPLTPSPWDKFVTNVGTAPKESPPPA